ncbi:MAG TPA: hypothetical protein VFZ76_02465 [Anaerolineales bacterium]
MVGFAIAGVRLGRKTYLVDGAPKLECPLYVTVSNTLIGVLTLVGSGFGFIADFFGIRFLIDTLTGLAVVAILASYRLPEAEVMSASAAP